jgi:hypothetical protein
VAPRRFSGRRFFDTNHSAGLPLLWRMGSGLRSSGVNAVSLIHEVPCTSAEKTGVASHARVMRGVFLHPATKKTTPRGARQTNLQNRYDSIYSSLRLVLMATAAGRRLDGFHLHVLQRRCQIAIRLSLYFSVNGIEFGCRHRGSATMAAAEVWSEGFALTINLAWIIVSVHDECRGASLYRLLRMYMPEPDWIGYLISCIGEV